MKQITKYKQTCPACPTQYDLWTDTGNYVYFRYRYGICTIDLDNKEIYYKKCGSDLDGYMTVEQVIAHLGEAGFDTSVMKL